jgi:hypothetical protein
MDAYLSGLDLNRSMHFKVGTIRNRGNLILRAAGNDAGRDSPLGAESGYIFKSIVPLLDMVIGPLLGRFWLDSGIGDVELPIAGKDLKFFRATWFNR